MMTYIVGLFLLIIPFLLIGLFSDKKKGFIFVLFFSLLFQSLLGLLTQFFGVFHHNVIIAATLLVDIVIIFTYLKSKSKTISVWAGKIDWVAFLVVAISLLSLYQIHYNYSGKISLAMDQAATYHEMKNMKYVYPYFSDEWYAISLISGSINSHSLPVMNNLAGEPFLNLELFFHSFFAEIILILGLNCLTQYTLLSIFLNALIILLIYVFLKINKISSLTAGICALMALYITCGASLPGLWNLLPLNLGILVSLVGFCFMSLGSLRMAFLALTLAALFYPPIAIFSFVGFLVFYLEKLIKNGKKASTATIYCIIFIFLAFALFFIARAVPFLDKFIDYAFSKIFFVSLLAPYVPRLNFYNILPLPTILLAILGIYSVFKQQKWLFAEFIFGVVAWRVCSLTANRFFIEYERLVIFVSIIVTIISGFGLKYIEEKVKLKFQENGEKIFKAVQVFALLVFVFLIPFYTQRENWKEIVLVGSDNVTVGNSRAPANNYLTQDDLKIFKYIKNKVFLSIPWKGTVIGVATNNYPIVTKEGTISVGNSKIIDNFINSDCDGKVNIANKNNLDYVYLSEFDCINFDKIAESSEGLVLYKFKN